MTNHIGVFDLSKEYRPGGIMKKTEESVSWVVYRMTIYGKPSQNAVCEQNEWDAMESKRPGYDTLIRAGIANEGEAERLARSTPLDQAIPCAPI
jgi:hypothetical protein